jgi:hypothetical protein
MPWAADRRSTDRVSEPDRVSPEGGRRVQWWVWLIIVVAVIVVAIAAFLVVQARRRSGGVISVRDEPGGSDRS